MTPQRRRTTKPTVDQLEGRLLMTVQAPTSVWIGQDGHDLVGPTLGFGPDGVQDMHIVVSGLPADRTVVKIETQGYGSCLWLDYISPAAPSNAAWIQAPGSTTADLYLEPYIVETGRLFFTTLTYDDGTTVNIQTMGGQADPNLRMPDAAVSAQWMGQDGVDVTGSGPSVGPDGFQDVRIDISGLSTKFGMTSATLTSSGGAAWSFGTNPTLASNAEFVLNPTDPTKGSLWFTPVAGLAGQTMTLTILYTEGKSDQTTFIAGASDPSLAMPATAPIPVTWGPISASWIGQDGQNLVGAGDVHVALSGLSAGRQVVSATLSDESSGDWIYQADGTPAGAVDPNALPLALVRSTTDPTRADLDFPPIRNETGATLTLRLVLDDGSMVATRFSGGAADPGLRAPDIAATSFVAHPGDDLVTLVNQYGTIHLSAGTYQLIQPLLLQNPVTITADPGATLLFSQGASDPAWTTAINISCGHTTLDGFAVRFAGPIRWTTDNSGPSVIGNSFALPGGLRSTLVDITLTHLDLMSPPAASSWEEAPHLIWMANAQSGVISGNTLKGGMTEFFNGPWTITNNTYLGTVPQTFTYGVFGGHYTHDLLLANNTAQPQGASGKTWRFLVLTMAGQNDVISGNRVSGIGPMDSDTVANPNASEVVLTEAYRLHFEGAPTVISPDGWVVQIPTPQGGAARTGDVVSILKGPDAGQWRRIAQAISSTAYLLDSPLSPGDQVISIATGFVGETFQNNTIDARGSSTALDMVLNGNHYGTNVINNHLLGGAIGMLIAATPTEMPNIWGWSRAPFLGATIAGNVVEDARQASMIDVQHGAAIKTDAGRTYMSVTFQRNTIVWSDAFLASLGQSLPLTFVIGDSLSQDPTELALTAQGNAIQGPPAITGSQSLIVYAATVNGQPMVQGKIPFSPVLSAPTGLALVNDSGSSSTDLITNDGRLAFVTVASLAGYEYSLTGAEGTFQPIATPGSFSPVGLVQGSNSVFVRGYTAQGQRTPSASLTFVFDTVAPGPVTGLIATTSGEVDFAASGPGDVYEYRIGGSTTYIPLGTATSFSTSDLLAGPRTVQVHAIDAAGNVGPDAITTMTPQWVAVSHPAPVPRPAPAPVHPPHAVPVPIKPPIVRASSPLPVNLRVLTTRWERDPFPFARAIHAKATRPAPAVHAQAVRARPAALHRGRGFRFAAVRRARGLAD